MGLLTQNGNDIDFSVWYAQSYSKLVTEFLFSDTLLSKYIILDIYTKSVVDAYSSVCMTNSDASWECISYNTHSYVPAKCMHKALAESRVKAYVF